jgi:hypothetical protein
MQDETWEEYSIVTMQLEHANLTNLFLLFLWYRMDIHRAQSLNVWIVCWLKDFKWIGFILENQCWAIIKIGTNQCWVVSQRLLGISQVSTEHQSLNPSGYHTKWYPIWKLDHRFSHKWKLDGDNWLSFSKIKIVRPS